MKIGVFDSGVGGLTVLEELKIRLKGADLVYLGDTAHVPYGPRSAAQVRRLSVDCARTLASRGIEALVVACNTASSVALEAIAEAVRGIPVFGVVEPGIESVLRAIANRGGRPSPVAVLATRATVRSGAYGKTLRAILESAATTGHPAPPVFEVACPLLVPMIEEGWVDHPILHQTLAEYVGWLAKEQPSGVALLGCTHYPWIDAAFSKALPGWTVVNSARAVAEAFEASDFWAGRGKPKGTSQVEWIFTDPDAVPGFARKWIGGDS